MPVRPSALPSSRKAGRSRLRHRSNVGGMRPARPLGSRVDLSEKMLTQRSRDSESRSAGAAPQSQSGQPDLPGRSELSIRHLPFQHPGHDPGRCQSSTRPGSPRGCSSRAALSCARHNRWFSVWDSAGRRWLLVDGCSDLRAQWARATGCRTHRAWPLATTSHAEIVTMLEQTGFQVLEALPVGLNERMLRASGLCLFAGIRLSNRGPKAAKQTVSSAH